MSTTARSTATSSACGRSSATWTTASTRSKPSMASDTDTASPERRPKRAWIQWIPGSRLGLLIILLNALGLAVLIVGSLVLNEYRRGLIIARQDSLTTQGEL